MWVVELGVLEEEEEGEGEEEEEAADLRRKEEGDGVEEEEGGGGAGEEEEEEEDEEAEEGAGEDEDDDDFDAAADETADDEETAAEEDSEKALPPPPMPFHREGEEGAEATAPAPGRRDEVTTLTIICVVLRGFLGAVSRQNDSNTTRQRQRKKNTEDLADRWNRHEIASQTFQTRNQPHRWCFDAKGNGVEGVFCVSLFRLFTSSSSPSLPILQQQQQQQPPRLFPFFSLPPIKSTSKIYRSISAIDR